MLAGELAGMSSSSAADASRAVPPQPVRQASDRSLAVEKAVDAAVAVGGAAARLAGKGFKMGAKALFGTGKSKKNTGKK